MRASKRKSPAPAYCGFTVKQWVKVAHNVFGRVTKLEPERGTVLVRLASTGRRYRYPVSRIEAIDRPILGPARQREILNFAAQFAV